MNQHLTTRLVSIVIGSVIGILLIIAGFRLFQSVFTRAEDIAPRDVIVSEISQNTVKVSWSTGEENQAVIEYGTSPTALNFFAPESQRIKTHAVDLTLLSPATTYYFQIRIADQKFDNGGVPWTFTTKGTERSQPASTNPVLDRPTPVSTIVLQQEEASVPEAATCTETDCQKIKDKLGKGCTTGDYFRCVKKLTPTAAQ